MVTEAQILALLRQEMQPAYGVTEPAAIALACARAYRAVGGTVNKVRLRVDGGIYKNCYSCAIPGTTAQGNGMAALLGVLSGDPDLDLEVLQPVREADAIRAAELLAAGVVELQVDRNSPGICIDARVETEQGYGRAIIRDRHANVVAVEANGEQVLSPGEANREAMTLDIREVPFSVLMEFPTTVAEDRIRFVLDAVVMNQALAQAGMSGVGLGLGKVLAGFGGFGQGADLAAAVQTLVGCALDARVGGVPLPAMSIAGSGAHGVIATLPLAAAAAVLESRDEALARAVVLSFLVTLAIKARAGRLSAYCGCAIGAGTGAAAGLAYLLGGTPEQVGAAVSNMAANITGMICDGGNYGCSLKAVTAAGAAVLAARLAVQDKVVGAGSGIVGRTVEETLTNMGRIASPGMRETENVILDILAGME